MDKEKLVLAENDELNKIIDEFNSDVQVTVQNIREKALMVSTIRSKWLARYMKEKENLERISALKAKILKEKVANGASQSILNLKSKDIIEQSDDKIQRLNKLYKMTQSIIEYLERGFNILDGFGFQIKTVHEILKSQGV